MTGAQPPIKAATESATGATIVEPPLFLAPPPTDQASARAAVIEARAAADVEPTSPPVLRFSSGT